MRTFLFSDLRDYTGFIETKGDAAAAKMLRASRRIVRDAVVKHRGAEIKTEGDSFYVVFRSPSSALRCALDAQAAAARYTTAHPETPVRMGIGINTGEAIPHDKGYVGSAVIVANRLSTSAHAGQILVTDTVRSLIRTGAHASMRDLGAWALKGIAEPVHVFEVEAARPNAPQILAPALPLPAMLLGPPRSAPGLVVSPELVQREQPLAALMHHLEAAAKGETRIVALSGEGGIGKSRLVREVAAAAQAGGMYVLGGRAHASGPPYEPIVVSLRPYAHARGTEILRRLLGPLVVELRRLLPEMAFTDADAGPEMPTEERRERFLRMINLLLEDATAQRPVLLVLEDLHDADEATRDLLRYLAASFRSGLCLILTYREEEVGPAHPLRALLAELDRDRRLARISLSPLDLAGVERMTAALLPGRHRTRPLARAIFERSEGVPFYVEELLKTALDDPDTRPEAVALPRTVADSVRLRVTRLVALRGPGVADLLEAAAVADVPFGYEALIELSGRDEGEAGADLAAAVDAQLLERTMTRDDIYQFRHALTREAIASGIPPARRRRLHARVAKTIEAQGDPAPRAALLARHFEAAGDRGKAVLYARMGAANAARVGAFAGAIDLLREAVAMASGTSDEAEVLEESAGALQAAGRAAEAEEALTRAAVLARERSDSDGVARLDVKLAAVLRMEGRRADAIGAVKRAIDALTDRPGELLAQALATHAALAWAENDDDQAIALATQGLQLAERSGAGGARVAALTTLGAALSRRDAANGRRRLEEAITTGVAIGDVAGAANAYLELSRSLQRAGQWEPARVASLEGAELAGRHGLELTQADLLAQLAFVTITLGRYQEARDAAGRAVALARRGTVAAITARTVLADALAMLGEADAALRVHLELADELPRADPERRIFMLGSRARAELGVGRIDDAWSSVRASLELAEAAPPGSGVTAFLIAGDVVEAKKDLVAARDILTAFDRHFGGFDSPHARVVRAELEAIVSCAEGRPRSEDFAEIARAYETLGVPVRAAYRRGMSAALRIREFAADPVATADLSQSRSELRERGALRYLGLIDDVLPLSWTVDAGSAPATVERARP